MPSLPFRVKAIYEYTSPHDDDLHFPNGQIITVTEEEDDDWYTGEYVDASGVKQEGIFPKNFVEKYEPTAPPRPIRASRLKKEEHVPVPVPEPEPAQIEPAHELEPEPEPQRIPEVSAPLPAARDIPPPAPKQQADILSPPAPKPIPASSKPSAPPPVSEKPSSGSFRDRIAAFNKAAPPVAPFKPGGLSSGGSNNFIKKPFVAPPPSKNAYVPVPREPPPPRIYRREEDPEIAAKETENQELAERSGLASTSNEGKEEDQPKPTSLKERIALLQKQQMEQAARHADAAQKKEKPKRPVKKRTDPHDTSEATEERDPTNDPSEPLSKPSIESTREARVQPARRKSSRGGPEPGIHPREFFVDGNDADMSGAGDTTEDPEEISTGRDDSDEKPKTASTVPPRAPTRELDGDEEQGASEEDSPAGEENEEEEDEEDEDIDPEVRRKEELRARMAKMSGGMGMHGMFGPPGGMPPMAPPKKKKSLNAEKQEEEVVSPTSRAPLVPMIPMPGMSRVRSPEENNKPEDEETTPISMTRSADEIPDIENIISQERGAPPPVPIHEFSAPPIPGGRPAPPPVPKESRPFVPVPTSPSAGSESDAESSTHGQTPGISDIKPDLPPPPPKPAEGPISPKSPAGKRMSYFGSDQTSPTSVTSPTTPGNKRLSRVPPPIPGAVPANQPQNRAPPPPPPGAPPSRSPTGDQRPPIRDVAQTGSEEEVTEYEGDYDTDIASAAPHKDALKAHTRDSSFDDSLSVQSPITSPSFAPPPLPPIGAPRAIPPPLPSQPPPNSRQSAEMPRAAPPPPPPAKMAAPWEQDDDEYDPYNYSVSKPAPPPAPSAASPRLERNEDLYSASPPGSYAAPAHDRPAPLTPGREAMMTGGRAPPRHSMDVQRTTASTRRSVDLSRISMDHGFVASDIDLAPNSFWWTQPKGIPPVLNGRKDTLTKLEELSAKRGSKTIITKELYILYQDYSQTIIRAQFDAQNPADVKLEQAHDPPPSRQRQDQLEQAHDQFGRRISETIASKKETIVGDGTPQGLIQELLRPLPGALLPIGTRAYGAVVYSNLANASTQQNDEIRPGDIITLRNTKFQGKHGPMHAKYSMEVGKPDHVGVVAEWDGTKKKVRAWEQGRESKKVKLESFKLDDLRSGEVKIWRVMPKGWVGWQ